LAIFSSSRDGLFEVIQLTRAVPARVVIEAMPYVEPMLAAVERRRWLVALVNRRSAWLLAGSPERLREDERVDDDVRGQHEQGGWSQARYERSVDKDVMDHLRSVAETVNRRWRQERFDRIVVGGPQEVVVRFEELLADEVRDRLAPRKVDVDLSSATEAQVRSEVERIVVEDESRSERETLDRFQDALGSGTRATAGLGDTLQALNERRVQTLLLAPGFDPKGGRCPSDGMLVPDVHGRCAGDGAPIQRVEHMREAVVQVAVFQDADVLVITHYPDREPPDGIGALLRF
jgi:peptide subunit release factor 1 (eRF1)